MKKKKQVAAMLGVGAAVTAGGLIGPKPTVHAATKVPLTAGTQVTQSQEDQLGQLSAAKSAAAVASDTASSAAVASSSAAAVNQQAQTAKSSAAVVASSAADDLSSAASDVSAASQAVSAARSVAGNVNSATIASASAAVNDKSAAVVAAQSASSVAAHQADQAKSAASAARQAVSAAQHEYDLKSAAYASAASAVAAASSATSSAELAAASAALSTANATLSAVSAAYSAAQQSASSAAAAKASADDSLAAAQSAASVAANDAQTANDSLTAAQSAASQAQSAASEANSSYQVAQQQTSAAQSAYNQASAAATPHSILNGNRIELPANYITAVKNLADYENQHPNDTSSDTYLNLLNAIQATVPAVSQQTGRVEGYTYRSNEADRQQTVDYKNLTLEQRIEISKFAGALVNDIRQQMGEAALKVTPASVKYAYDTVQQGYNAVNWQMFGDTMNDNRGHNNAYLEQHMRDTDAAGEKENASMGLYQYQIDGVTRAVSRVPVYSGQVTMDDLKHTIYDDIVSMMLNDNSSQWGHTTNFAIPMGGMTTSDTMGVDFDKYGASHYDFAGAYSGNTFGNDAYNLAATTSGDAAALQSASAALSAVQSAEATASSAANSAVVAQSAAADHLSAAQQAASSAQNTLTQASAAVSSAQTAASQADETADHANSVAAERSAAVDTAANRQSAAAAAYQQAVSHQGSQMAQLQSAADQASAAASHAQAALSAATSSAAAVQQQADQASSAASDAQSSLVAAQHDLQTAQTTYQQYQHAQSNLTAAEGQLAAKQAILHDKQQAASQANASLATASSAAAAAQSNADRTSLAAASAAAANDAAQQLVAATQAGVQSQAEMYGPSVSAHEITIHVGDAVPAPVLDNPLSISVRPLPSSLAMPITIILPAVGNNLTVLPVGTTVAWADPAQVARDAAVAGDHEEVAIVTFPDGSTMNVRVPLHVTGNQQGEQQTDDHQQGHDSGQPAQPQGSAADHGVLAAGNPHVAAGVAGSAASRSTLNGAAQSAVHSHSARLPQTGDQQNETMTVLGMAMAVMTASLASLLGIKRRH